MKIIFDVKCGFDECYIVERGIVYDLDLVAAGEALKQMATELNIETPFFPTEEEIYQMYGENANEFMIDYNLYSLLEDLMKEAIASTFLRDICFGDLENKENQYDLSPVEMKDITDNADWYEPSLCEISNLKFYYDSDKKETNIVC